MKQRIPNNQVLTLRIAIVAVALMFCPAFAQSNEPNSFDIYNRILDSERLEERQCKDEAASETGEKFLKAYLSGKTAEAERLWALMLKHLSKTSSIDSLGHSLYTRYVLEIPDGATLHSRYSRESLYRFILAATDKAVGKNHRFYMDCLGEVAYIVEGTKKWQEGETIRIRQYRLAERCLGKESEKTLAVCNRYAWDKIHLRQYVEAESMLKNTIQASERHGYKKPLVGALKVYLYLLQTTNRTADANKLVAQWRSHRW
jgi:hypothetical protein